MRERSDELEVYCKAWPVRISKHFHKRAFVLDWEQQSMKNLFDLRRCAVVHNLHVLIRSQSLQADLQEAA